MIPAAYLLPYVCANSASFYPLVQIHGLSTGPKCNFDV
jgi:hypothetical protein